MLRHSHSPYGDGKWRRDTDPGMALKQWREWRAPWRGVWPKTSAYGAPHGTHGAEYGAQYGAAIECGTTGFLPGLDTGIAPE